MNISFSTPQTSFTAKKLIPLSQYKGPVLKLTKTDKEKIAVLENSIAALEIELYSISKYQRKKISEKQKFLSDSAQMHLDARIRLLRQEIQDIKMNRLNKQRANLDIKG